MYFFKEKHTHIWDVLNYYVELGSGDEHNAQAYRAQREHAALPHTC